MHRIAWRKGKFNSWNAQLVTIQCSSWTSEEGTCCKQLFFSLTSRPQLPSSSKPRRLGRLFCSTWNVHNKMIVYPLCSFFGTEKHCPYIAVRYIMIWLCPKYLWMGNTTISTIDWLSCNFRQACVSHSILISLSLRFQPLWKILRWKFFLYSLYNTDVLQHNLSLHKKCIILDEIYMMGDKVFFPELIF